MTDDGAPNDVTSPTTGDPLVRVERNDDGVDVVTLSHGKVNALCVELLDQLHAVATELTADRPRAVVVTGGPKLFAAGADITEFAERGGAAPFRISPSDRVAQIGGSFLRALNAVAALPCPTIAAVNGVALGGGCELALACDLRVASTTARLVGPARAKDLVFSGRMVDATEAAAIGLVDSVVEGDARDAALELAARYARGPREATALAKQAIDEGLAGTLEDGLLLEQRLFVSSFGMDDATVGVASFLEHGPGTADFA